MLSIGAVWEEVVHSRSGEPGCDRMARSFYVRLLAIAFGLWLAPLAPARAVETSLKLDSELGDYAGLAQQYFFTPSDGTFTAQRPWSTSNAVYISVQTRAWPFWQLYFAAPNNQPLTVGTYENATRFPFEAPPVPGLAVYGAIGCDSTGRFTVREIAYGAGDAIDSFWATFEHYCGTGAPALIGEIRFNAHVVVTITAPKKKTIEQSHGLTFNVNATEANGNIVALTVSGLPPGATFTDNHDNTGTFAWTPDATQNGPFAITFQADNGLGAIESATTDISVGTLIHVPADMATIQGAINSAFSGSRILVAPGFYRENVDFLDKDIKLVSEEGPEVTIIDGNRAAPAVTIGNRQSRESLLSGFTIQNGDAYGAVFVRRSYPIVTGNFLTSTSCGGGGIGIEDGEPIIQANTLKGNENPLCPTGGIGAGGWMSAAQILDNVVYDNAGAIGGSGRPGHPTVIRGNILFENRFFSEGYGYFCIDAIAAIVAMNDSVVTQNVVFDNYGVCSGGIWATGNAVITNNTVVGNSGREGSQLYLDFFTGRVANNIFAGEGTAPIVYCERSTPSMFNFNDLFNPTGMLIGDECPIDLTNIPADPQFVDASYGDFRLNPGSPVVDRGDNSVPELTDFDIDGVDRIVDGDANGQAVVDMGAHEFAPNPGEFHFESAGFSTLENSGTALISVLRKAGKTGTVSVDFHTADGTARAGSDYNSTSGTLSFADGETRKTFSVSILDDSIVEGKETVNLYLSNPFGGAILGRQSSAVLTIDEVGATLTVDANAGTALNVTVTPNDSNGQGNGATRFTRLFSKNASVTLVAPPTAGDKNFISWTGCDSVSGATCVLSMSKDKTVTAMYAKPSPISILSPANGAAWRVGSKQSIRWSTADASNMAVLISRNGGATWSVISKKTPNVGDLLWKVKKPATGQAIIRVCGVTIPVVCADSSPFAIQ